MRKILAAAFGAMGVLHFAKPEPFNNLIPEALPGTPTQWTYFSGVWELGTAALLLAKPAWGGLATVGTSLAVWPGNFKMAWDWRHEPAKKQIISVGRLPLQIPLIMAGWKIYTDNK
ncbi:MULTISPECIES: hypothetical protein [Corynebacterium]|uniref:DoxX family protein n=2 Tax=Corynebacterium glucuronolyticum TaxID=39791 RepID=A0A7T4EFR8_9CORY|nr:MULTISPECIES: hypothetical protein [Corynebacterium]EEI28206.1 hypothetical protein HMPREF0294_0386 [Corynebacterium glucuronolyticum ATCC 51867]EEI63535.1 hypothetical protein HMPREF0293_0914 [Corynebacterium glucuronolyticum ATCC 51866]MCT1442633.1 hypothetical protein [Corynebacterium glucuronolyticum]MCT1563329.1 hypothetical protein [Corynebacterium glucuronolyticum]OFO43936.1 hypothetical protein HMPREF3044_12210 [Corynebacterium sp. HMSC073D01]